jgi:hypothetical protein
MAVTWVTKNISRMDRKRALKRWESKMANSEVRPQSIWPIAKSLSKMSGPKKPYAVHGP